jgi:uncharacterized protein (DUF1800 family)
MGSLSKVWLRGGRLFLLFYFCQWCPGHAADDLEWIAHPSPPNLSAVIVTNGQVKLSWQPYPAIVDYQVMRATEAGGPYTAAGPGTPMGYSWSEANNSPALFYRIGAVPMASNDLLAATVMNRLAYGPTPDLLERMRTLGPDAYIREQLSPESIVENLDLDRVETLGGWRHVVVTGTATSSRLYLYLTAAGEIYVDDLRLVRGGDLAAGTNLVRQGEFEAPLSTNDWMVSSNFISSIVTGNQSHSGSSSLKLVATRAGAGADNSIWQDLKPALTNGQVCTLDFWYLAPSNANSGLVIRLSGASSAGQLRADADATVSPRTRLESAIAGLADLRAWHIQHAIQSQRQLAEVMAQFLENHFVTQQSKSRDYLSRYYKTSTFTDIHATRMEWTENHRWREAWLNPQCTFLDLLRISAESPAMIIYLDTVASRGDGGRAANENYARELLELFTFGVDSGYDQSDIVELSKVWTGWRIRLVEPKSEFDPLAPQSTLLLPGGTDTNNLEQVAGIWALSYRSNYHNATNKTIFAGKTIPARFGPAYSGRTYAGQSVPGRYELSVRGRRGNDGIDEGYEVLAHMAALPFTQEFISVKLCRWFVHDNFEHGIYDYTDPNLSAEGKLVQQCMEAWDSSQPKGQLRRVLDVIFHSDLFRGHGASRQKVKTPLEFTVSTVRALRAALPNGSFTANGESAGIVTALGRMGGMSLFNRNDPNGYPEDAAGWISAGTLAARLRFVQAFLTATTQSNRADDAGASSCQPVTLIKQMLPSSQWRDPGAISDFFLELLLPGEGRANVSAIRAAAIGYLNTADNGATTSLLSDLSDTSATYELRVRGLIAMLLSTARFQEQ